MARYKLTITCEIDECYPLSAHTGLARSLIIDCCPQEFGIGETYSFCKMSDCKECWLRALSEGVKKDVAKHVYSRRVD